VRDTVNVEVRPNGDAGHWHCVLERGRRPGFGLSHSYATHRREMGTASAETRSRTKGVSRTTGHRQRKSPEWSGSDPRHSSCLWFQILGVEAHSSLPYDQYDGGNLPGQGQSCHLRPHAFGQQCRIELCERTRLDRSHDRRTLEEVLQIVIAVLVQPASLLPLLLASELALLHLVIGTAAGSAKRFAR